MLGPLRLSHVVEHFRHTHTECVGDEEAEKPELSRDAIRVGVGLELAEALDLAVEDRLHIASQRVQQPECRHCRNRANSSKSARSRLRHRIVDESACVGEQLLGTRLERCWRRVRCWSRGGRFHGAFAARDGDTGNMFESRSASTGERSGTCGGTGRRWSPRGRRPGSRAGASSSFAAIRSKLKYKFELAQTAEQIAEAGRRRRTDRQPTP